MLSTPNKPTTCHAGAVLWLVIILVGALAAAGLFKYTMLKLRVAFADGQVAIFEATKASASKTSEPTELSRQLAYVVNYYPSGTKQISGTQIDRIVEAERSDAIRSIIGRLRATTGKDLGDDPQQWLRQ